MVMAGGGLVLTEALWSRRICWRSSELQFAAQVGEGPKIARDIDENDGQERHDDDHGRAGLASRGT